MPKMTADEIGSFMQKVFPQARMPVEIEELRDGFLRIRVPVTYSIPPDASRSPTPSE